MQHPSITVSIVTWNSEAFILDCLKSLSKQTKRDFVLTVVDNASRDSTVARIREEFPQVKILQHTMNLGFARAHNHAIAIARTPYMLVLNPDVILSPEYLAEMYETMEKNQKLGSAQGKLCRFSFSPADDLRQPMLSDILDSTGIIGTRSRSFKNRGEGENDSGQYDTHLEVLGPTGACAFYRRAALQSIQYEREFFDEDFFAYVEDSDLAWRLQICGWESVYVPRARAWHYRNIQGAAQTRDTLAFRATRSIAIRRRAVTNALAVLIKNLDGDTFRRNIFRIVGREFVKAGYILLREPRVFPAYWQLLRLLARFRRKRKIIQRHRITQPPAINRFFA